MKRLKTNMTRHKHLIGVLVFVGVFVTTLAFLLLTKNSFADEPVRDVSADSVHTSYSSREQGAWQVGALKNLESTFSKDSGITSVEALRNWNVESVTSIRWAFRYMTGVMDFSPLDDWLTKNANIGSITNTYAFSDGAAGAILPSWY